MRAPVDSKLHVRDTGHSTADSAGVAGEESLPDVQGFPDQRRVAIDKVGIKGLSFPVVLFRNDGSRLETIAQFDMSVSLPPDRKGTHMSRFVEALGTEPLELSGSSLERLATDLCRRLDTEAAWVSTRFTYVIEKAAPVTGGKGLVDYRAWYCVRGGDTTDTLLGVEVPATSLCPCSKEIAVHGAHNQRALITAEIRHATTIGSEEGIEELIGQVESAASCEVYSLLKRPDEKYVTERAYENPKFVEDIVRDLALLFNQDERILWYRILTENQESIHNHNATAEIVWDKRG